jgi:vacuolar protein sorting-associated protein 13A/C
LERINIDLQVQNSIVPTAVSLARFKVSGKLPTLQVNLSDTKYKSLMRLIDVCVPKFEGDADKEPPPPTTRTVSGAFQLPSGLFGQPETEYNIDDEDEDVNDDDDDDDEGSVSREDLFFEAEDGSSEVRIFLSCGLAPHIILFSVPSCINTYSNSTSRLII